MDKNQKVEEQDEMIEHENQDKVIDDSTTLIHGIFTASMHTYLLRAFHLLFLLYTKVSVVLGNVFNAVRSLGAADDAANYRFTLDVKRNDLLLLSKPGSVEVQGNLEIQEPTSLTLDTNNLLNLLDGFDGATFTVTVKRKLNNADDQPERVVEKCAECAEEVTVFLYRDKDGWRCERCAPARRSCKNQPQGCTHTDIDIKCFKHELYFCQQSTGCRICWTCVPQGSLSAHYGSVHQDITRKAGSTWRAAEDDGQYCLVSSVAGTAMCDYTWLLDSKLALRVYIPRSNKHLSEFRCEVRVTDPATGQAHTYTPDTLYDSWSDWHIVISKNDFPSWNTEFEVCVDISKVKSS